MWLAGFSTHGVAAAFYKLLFYPAYSSHTECRFASVLPGEAAVRPELFPPGDA